MAGNGKSTINGGFLFGKSPIDLFQWSIFQHAMFTRGSSRKSTGRGPKNCGFPQEATFLEGAFSVATFHEGGTFLLPASVQAVSYQAGSDPGFG